MKREHNLSTIHKRGILAATEECLLCAMSLNLKRMAKAIFSAIYVRKMWAEDMVSRPIIRRHYPAVCSRLRPWSRSLGPSMTINRSVSIGKAGAADGISRPFCPMLEIVHPVSVARMSTHRLTAS